MPQGKINILIVKKNYKGRENEEVKKEDIEKEIDEILNAHTKALMKLKDMCDVKKTIKGNVYEFRSDESKVYRRVYIYNEWLMRRIENNKIDILIQLAEKMGFTHKCSVVKVNEDYDKKTTEEIEDIYDKYMMYLTGEVETLEV